MKAQTAFVPNKKLILHFDVNDVITLSQTNFDLYVPKSTSRFMNFVQDGFGEN